MRKLQFEPIGLVHSCFKEKFGVPRQANLANSASATIEILSPYNDPTAFTGLEDFSHIWVIFCFHLHTGKKWQARVRPPRLGGNQKTGVFATRSSFRPNPIGISAVRLERVDCSNKKVILNVSGQDFIDQTPVLDIKPYVAYADAIDDAVSGFASDPPAQEYSVEFAPDAESTIEELSKRLPNIRKLIVETLSLDPRPSYQNLSAEERLYGMKLYDFDVKFTVINRTVRVIELIEL